MDANLEELQAIEGTMKSISDLQEEMPDEDGVQNLNDTYNTLAGIKGLMEEMEIPSLEKLNEICAKLLAIKKVLEYA